MTKHAFAAYIVSVNKRWRSADRQSLGNLNGIDLLHLMHGLLVDLKRQHLRVEKPSQRLLIVKEIRPIGRSIKFKTEYGRYGLDGSIVDAETAIVTHRYGENESAVNPTRNMIVLPKNGQYGVLLAERYGGGGAITLTRQAMGQAVRHRFSEEFTLRIEGLQDSEAWQAYIERSSMTELSISRYGLSSDSADPSIVSTVGKVATLYKPHRSHLFPNNIKSRLANRQVTAHELIGIPFHEEDEVAIKLRDGEQEKQLIIGQTEPSTLVYSIADDSAPRPSDEEVYNVMSQKVPDFGGVIGATIPHGWDQGEWSDQEKAVTMYAYRG